MASSTRVFNYLSRWIRNSLQRSKHSQLSRYKAAKESMRARRTTWTNIRSVLFMVLGIFSASFGLKGFLIPGGLIDGGVTGISLLINQQTYFPFAILLVLINLPFILLGWRQIG